MNRSSPLTLGETYKFFGPLIFMAELHMLSHAVIAAFLARMSDPEPILAAYSIAFYLHATLGSPVWACQFVAISYIRDKASMWRLLMFSNQTFLAVGWFWALVALTPLGTTFFMRLFGASQAVALEAQACMVISTLIVPFVFFRSLAYALLMIRRRTLLVTLGTVIRLIGLAGILALLTVLFPDGGAVIGMGALTACIGVESVYAVVAAAKYYRELPAREANPPTYRELWRFGWPVMLMQTAESGVAFTANFFLGRLTSAELAIAAFGVLDGMMRVLLGPLRNLIATVQTLTRGPDDVRVILIFATQIALVFGLVLAAFHLDTLRHWSLESVMGLPPAMASYIGPALLLAGLLALAMTAASLARGLLLASRKTGIIAVSSLARLLAVAGAGLYALANPHSNGAVIGVLCLIAAFTTEALILGLRILYAERRGGLFDTVG